MTKPKISPLIFCPSAGLGIGSSTRVGLSEPILNGPALTVSPGTAVPSVLPRQVTVISVSVGVAACTSSVMCADGSPTIACCGFIGR